jgi:hypothetical protein
MTSQQFCEEWTKNAETCKTQLRQESTRHQRRFNRVWASYLLGASCAEEAHRREPFRVRPQAARQSFDGDRERQSSGGGVQARFGGAICH